MADMFENVKKGDVVLITERVDIPGSHAFSVYRKITVDRVYQKTFVVAGVKFYKHNGEYEGGNRYERRHVRPIGQKWEEVTAERECEINENVQSLKLVLEVARKLERRNNASLARNKAHCDFIRTAMVEINKLFQEN